MVSNLEAVGDAEEHLEHPKPHDEARNVVVRVRGVVVRVGIHVAQSGELTHRAEAKDASGDDRRNVDATDESRADEADNARSVADNSDEHDHVDGDDKDESHVGEHEDR